MADSIGQKRSIASALLKKTKVAPAIIKDEDKKEKVAVHAAPSSALSRTMQDAIKRIVPQTNAPAIPAIKQVVPPVNKIARNAAIFDKNVKVGTNFVKQNPVTPKGFGDFRAAAEPIQAPINPLKSVADVFRQDREAIQHANFTADTGKMSPVQIKSAMVENSNKWKQATPAGRSLLHDQNMEMADRLNVSYDDRTGRYYDPDKLAIHSVGSVLPTKPVAVAPTRPSQPDYSSMRTRFGITPQNIAEQQQLAEKDWNAKGPGYGEVVGQSALAAVGKTLAGGLNTYRMMLKGSQQEESNPYTQARMAGAQNSQVYKDHTKSLNDGSLHALESAEGYYQKHTMSDNKLTGGRKFVATAVENGLPMLAELALGRGMGRVLGTTAKLDELEAITTKGLSLAKKAVLAAKKTIYGVPQMTPFATDAFGNYARQAEKDGANYNQQLAYGLTSAALEFVSEAPIVEGAFKVIKRLGAESAIKQGGKGLLRMYGLIGKDWLINSLKEAGQEAVIDPATNYAQKTIYDPNMKMGTGEGEVFDYRQMMADGYAGFATAVLLGGMALPGTVAYHRLQARIQSGQPADADFIEEIAHDLGAPSSIDAITDTVTSGIRAQTVAQPDPMGSSATQTIKTLLPSIIEAGAIAPPVKAQLETLGEVQGDSLANMEATILAVKNPAVLQQMHDIGSTDALNQIYSGAVTIASLNKGATPTSEIIPGSGIWLDENGVPAKVDVPEASKLQPIDFANAPKHEEVPSTESSVILPQEAIATEPQAEGIVLPQEALQDDLQPQTGADTPIVRHNDTSSISEGVSAQGSLEANVEQNMPPSEGMIIPEEAQANVGQNNDVSVDATQSNEQTVIDEGDEYDIDEGESLPADDELRQMHQTKLAKDLQSGDVVVNDKGQEWSVEDVSDPSLVRFTNGAQIGKGALNERLKSGTYSVKGEQQSVPQEPKADRTETDKSAQEQIDNDADVVIEEEAQQDNRKAFIDVLKKIKNKPIKISRIDTKDAVMSADKPQGLYVSMPELFDNFESPHEVAGDTTYIGIVTSKKPLMVDGDGMIHHSRMGGVLMGKSAGVAAVEVLDEVNFKHLLGVSAKKEMIDFIKTQMPGIEADLNRYYDTAELLEVYGAELARKNGYDTIVSIDHADPDLSEMVVLDNSVLKLDSKQEFNTDKEEAQPKDKETPATTKISNEPQEEKTGNVSSGFQDNADADVVIKEESQPKQEINADHENLTEKPIEKPSEDKHMGDVETGKKGTFYTSDNEPIKFHYAVVSADDLIASHDIYGNATNEYPQELQPRDRSRVQSTLQITKIANTLNPELLGESKTAIDGAPVVGKDMVVESGNGRTIAIKTMYANNGKKINDYKQFLKDNADTFGINADNLPENPVLVRVRDTDVDRTEFARKANESNIASMSASEIAKIDADKLDASVLGRFVANDDGNINTRENRDFIEAFLDKVIPSNERGKYVTADGMLSQEGLLRIRNAIFQKAYDNEALATKLFESLDDATKNITRSLLNVAPAIVKVKEGIKEEIYHNIDFSKDFAGAAELYASLKEEGRTIEDYLNQMTFVDDGMSNESKVIAGIFEANKRSARAITTVLSNILDAVKAMGNPNQVTMFGDVSNITKGDIINGAITEIERTADNSQISFFDVKPEERKQGGGNVEEVPQGEPTRQSEKQAEKYKFKQQMEDREKGRQQSSREATKAPHVMIADFVSDALSADKKISRMELQDKANKAYGGTMAEGKYSVKDMYDAMELGVNRYLYTALPALHKENGGNINAEKDIEFLKHTLDLLPAQKSRTGEMDTLQQFSTPPTIGYIATYLANINKNDVMLEPSAGIGGLAILAKAMGAKEIVVNELSERRLSLLRELPFNEFYKENGEQIGNILHDKIHPTVAIMNPPFSSTAGRTSKNSSANALKHVTQALNLLPQGGRLVAILGDGNINQGKLTTAEQEYFKSLKDKGCTLRANIGIDGKNYAKYGTSYNVKVIVVDKVIDDKKPTTGSFTNLEDTIPVLEGIRNERSNIERTVGTNTKSEQHGNEHNSKESLAGSQTINSNGHDISESANDIRSGKQSDNNRKPISGEDNSGNGIITTGNESSTADNADSERRPTESGENTDRQSEASVRRTNGDNSGEHGSNAGIEETGVQMEQPTRKQQKNVVESDDVSDTFARYKPQKAIIKGAQAHPGELVQSHAMAAVEPPNVTYTPNLPKTIITKGELSDAQLEAVVYAGQSFQQKLSSEETKGYFIGDGTGVGKGREIAGIIMDDFRHGSKKAVWISDKWELLESAKRDWAALGGNADEVLDFSKERSKKNGKQATEGIMYLPYTTLRTNFAPEMMSQNDDTKSFNVNTNQGKALKKPRGKVAIDDLVQWLGKDFDGVLAFDEAHNMRSASPVKGKRGTSKPSLQALAGIELQNRLPKAKVLYVSATGATEVSNLAYAKRLGLWGKGTAFGNISEFVSKVSSGGLAAMELVARDMKALGVYMARTLSFSGVTYESLMHNLTKEQRVIYEELAKAWQVVFNDMHKALEVVGADKKNNSAKMAVSRIWGAEQMFFNQILTAMQTPTMINDMEKQLEAGRSCVIQLVNTQEAQANRAIAKSIEENGELDLDDIDLTPRDMLMGFVDKAFPVNEYEEIEDENGNVMVRPVYDSEGNPVVNQEALAMKEELLDKLGSIRVPEAPIDMIVNHFGASNVAEITGRTKRVVEKQNSETGQMERVLEKRGADDGLAEEHAFMDGKKRILIFSQKGGTGSSFHADNTRKNKQKRIHYLLQPGWNIVNAVQGFGRTHRTNQADTPHYVLVTTDLAGHKRFITSVARRLEQLGALTKGQRTASGQGMFGEHDNLENEIGRAALEVFYTRLAKNQVYGIPNGYKGKEVLEKMGLVGKIISKDGDILENPEEFRDVAKFLNRLLGLEPDIQNYLFSEYDEIRMNAYNKAMEDGTLDTGTETYKADSIEVKNERVVYEDQTTGAETKYLELEIKNKAEYRKFNDIKKNSSFMGFYYNERSKRTVAFYKGQNRTLQSGAVIETVRYITPDPSGDTAMTKSDFERSNWAAVSEADAKTAWNEVLATLPDYKTDSVHLITGALLPIWDRLPEEKTKVYRIQTNSGETFLGRVIPEKSVDYTLQKLGTRRQKDFSNMQDIANKLQNGWKVELTGDWTIKQSKVSGEQRLEIVGNDLMFKTTELRDAGAFSERIDYKTRWFLPTGNDSIKALEKLTEYRYVTKLLPPSENKSIGADPFTGRQDTGEKEMHSGVNPLELFKLRKAKGETKQEHKPLELADPERQKWMDESRGLGKEGMIDRIKNDIKEFVEMSTRQFRHIDPKDENNARAIFELTNYPKLAHTAQDTVNRTLDDITRGLNKDQYYVFSLKIALEDFLEEAKAGRPIPFGYQSEEEVQEDLDRVNEYIKNSPDVADIQEALDKRKAYMEKYTEEYLQALEDIGINFRNKFGKQNYMRHQVLEYMRAKDKGGMSATTGTGSEIHIHDRRGFTKKRAGYSGAINMEFAESEFEVLSQMVFDASVAKMFKRLNDKYDIRPQLEQQAKRLNELAVQQIIEDEKSTSLADNTKLKNGKSETETALNKFKQKMGYAMKNLQELADNDELWEGDSGEFTGIVDKIRNGLPIDENADGSLMYYLSELANADGEQGQSWALTFFKAMGEKKAFIKELLGKNFKTWESIMPEGYEAYQPREGRTFFLANTVAEDTAEDLLSGTLDKLQGKSTKTRPVFAMGQVHRQAVYPVGLADTLESFYRLMPKSVFWRTWKKVNTALKTYYLTGNPRSVIKYNIRNVTGDLDHLIAAGAAKAARYADKSARDLYNAMTKMEFSKDLKEFRDFGGYSALYITQEIGDVLDAKPLRRLRAESSIVEKAKRVLPTYLEFTADLTNYREMILRYAAYLHYKDLMKTAPNHLPAFYAASAPAMIKGLDTVEERAYQMSNDTMGAYDQISETGGVMKQYFSMFWSWNEVNFKFYKRLMQNALTNEAMSEGIGRKVLLQVGVTTAAKVSAKTAILAAKVFLGMMGMTAAMAAWNIVFFGDDEDELPDNVKNVPHLIFGRDKNGNIIYFSRLGAMNDFLAWFGLDTIFEDLDNIHKGYKSIDEQKKDMERAAISKLWASMTPIYSIPLQLVFKQSTYPDVFDRRSIRDRFEFTASSFGVGNEYRKLTGMPTQDTYGESWEQALIYKSNPAESAYYKSLDLKQTFEKQVLGKEPSGGFNATKKSNALYYFKQSIKYGDKDAAYKYIQEYFKEGGTSKGMAQSIGMMSPAYGLSVDDGEYARMMKWLDKEDRKTFISGMKYYHKTYGNPKDEGERARFEVMQNVTQSNMPQSKKEMIIEKVVNSMMKRSGSK